MREKTLGRLMQRACVFNASCDSNLTAQASREIGRRRNKAVMLQFRLLLTYASITGSTFPASFLRDLVRRHLIHPFSSYA
jgi:hypothetical protein